MNRNIEKVIVKYNGKNWEFDFGSQAYIFGTAIMIDFDKNHSDEELELFVERVHFVYLADYNNTNLGALTEWMAKHYDEIQDLSSYDILDKFYEE